MEIEYWEFLVDILIFVMKGFFLLDEIYWKSHRFYLKSDIQSLIHANISLNYLDLFFCLLMVFPSLFES